MNVDDGERFGLWADSLSKFIYSESFDFFLSDFNLQNAGDLGGGKNKWDSKLNIKTIDVDETKKPDILDDILTHKGRYESLLCRFVLHYLSDEQIDAFFKNIATYFKGKMLVIQFHQDGIDLDVKRLISSQSQEGIKYFRSLDELKKLIPNIQKTKTLSYSVTPEFYKNRLKIDTELTHQEYLTGFLLDFK